MPIVSVLVVVRHGGNYLDEALASLVGQTLKDIEIIVVTNRSDYITLSKVDYWRQRDPRIVVARMDEGGLSRCSNFGVSMARGEYIARLDADDVSYPERLERQLAVMKASPCLGLLGTGVETIDARGNSLWTASRLMGHDAIVNRQRQACAFTHSTVMMKRTDFEDVGGYRSCLRRGSDYDLWLRLSERCQVDNIPDILIKKRFHGGNITNRKVIATAITILAVRAAAVARNAGSECPFHLGSPSLKKSLFLLNISKDEAIKIIRKRQSIIRLRRLFIVPSYIPAFIKRFAYRLKKKLY